MVTSSYGNCIQKNKIGLQVAGPQTSFHFSINCSVDLEHSMHYNDCILHAFSELSELSNGDSD